ncbi:hypothetical protein CLU79DRAFT_715889 [Phycomyces nitens]|nr:hypothetical protein CLU79DRAFT_715889 [Phycomyces nitens]
MYLLALDIMTSGHDSERDDYEQNWEKAVHIMSGLITTYTESNANINKLLDAAIFQDGLSPDFDCGGRSFDPRAQTLLHRFNVLENYVRNIQSKIFLCKHDTKTFSSGRGSAYSMERIGERFTTIDQDFSQMLSQWEETKETLSGFTRQDSSPRTSLLPSPPTSPRQTGIRSSGAIKRLSYIQQSRQKPGTATRQSLMTAAAVASFLENKRVNRLQSRQQSSTVAQDYFGFLGTHQGKGLLSLLMMPPGPFWKNYQRYKEFCAEGLDLVQPENQELNSRQTFELF